MSEQLNGPLELIEMQETNGEKFSLQPKSLVFMVNATLVFEKWFNDSKVATIHNNRSFRMLCVCLNEDSLPIQFHFFVWLSVGCTSIENFSDVYSHWISVNRLAMEERKEWIKFSFGNWAHKHRKL